MQHFINMKIKLLKLYCEKKLPSNISKYIYGSKSCFFNHSVYIIKLLIYNQEVIKQYNILRHIYISISNKIITFNPSNYSPFKSKLMICNVQNVISTCSRQQPRQAIIWFPGTNYIQKTREGNFDIHITHYSFWVTTLHQYKFS